MDKIVEELAKGALGHGSETVMELRALSLCSYGEFAVAFDANAVIIGLSRSRGGAVW